MSVVIPHEDPHLRRFVIEADLAERRHAAAAHRLRRRLRRGRGQGSTP